MGGTKRRRSLSPEISRKLQKPAPEASGVLTGEEDLQSILAMIREQEESEALARKLQQEFDEPQDNKVIDLTRCLDDVMPSNSGDAGFSTTEDDEAMARRLAHEWNQLDMLESSSKSSVVSERNDDMDHSATSNMVSMSQPSGSFRPASASLTYRTSPEEDLLRYRDVFTQSRNCTKCTKSVASPRNLVVFSSTIPPPTILALLHAVCDACGQSHCRGCFRALDCLKTCKGKHCNVSNCCAEVRAIALFEALGGFDRQHIGERECSNSHVKALNPRPKVATVGPGGTGYSTDSHDDYPRRSRSGINHSQTEDRKVAEASRAVATKWDDIVLRALDTITYLLPSPYAEAAAAYDFLPHPSIRSLISVSYLPEILGGLLINDSVTDWADRSDVYNSMLKLLRRMADSELTVGALVEQRWEKRKSFGVEDWMWGDGSIEWEKTPGTKDIVRAPPLYDHFKKLTRQCETFLAGASHLLQDGGEGEIEEMTVRATSLCGGMISAQQDMQRALSVIMRGELPLKDLTLKGKGKGRDQNVDMEKKYCVACEELAFKHITLSSESPTGGLVFPSYYYAQDVAQTANSARQPAKRLHLIKEVSGTSTSLPPGVWVRVDEVRNDVMKFLIAGPESTPYAGGLFEFDCFLPLDYPNVSPKVNLATTAGGRVRFNPNLYANGKVCLSLLGTWPGRPEEQWSSKSTLLQVLVSIQSMILVDAPFFNEPGFGQAKLGDARSIAYNKNIALQTVRWAIVDWMKEEHRNGIWADVIASHFTIRKQKIRKCIHKWAETDSERFRNYQTSSMNSAGTHHAFGQPSAHMADWGIYAGDNRYTKRQCPEPTGLDLLSEFDKGCAIIEGWARNQ